MNRFASVIILFAVLGLVPKMRKTKVGDIITLNVPVEFTHLTKEELNSKYVTPRQPIGAFASEDRTIELTINFTNTSWGLEDIEMVKNFYKSSLLNLYGDDIKWVTEEVQEINGRQFAVFELISTIKQEGGFVTKSPVRSYTNILYTIVEGRAYLFNFSCPAIEQSKWQETARAIMGSIEIKK